MATKAALEAGIRNEILEVIREALAEHFETDVLPVSAGELTVPVLDAEQNEKFGLIKVSIPRGTRNGEGGYEPYDGYAAAELYQEDLEKKAEKKAQEKKKPTKEQKQVKKAIENLEKAGLG